MVCIKVRKQVTLFQVACDELELRQGVDADQVGLHLLAGFLSRIPVSLLWRQLVAARLESLPTHVTVILLIVCPWVCGGTEIKKKTHQTRTGNFSAKTNTHKSKWMKPGPRCRAAAGALYFNGLAWLCAHWPVVKGSRVALGLFLQMYGRATEQSRFCQRPDDSVLITAQFSSSAWLGWSGNGHKSSEVKKN